MSLPFTPWETHVPLDGRVQTIQTGDYEYRIEVHGPHLTDAIRVEIANAIAAMPEIVAACEQADCSCTVAERDSGHKVGCWMPPLLAALDKAYGVK